MTGQVGAEDESRPPRGRRVGRRPIAGLAVLAVAATALGAAWWLGAAETDAPVTGQQPAAGPSGAGSTPERPAATAGAGQPSAGQTSSGPVPPIPGMTVEAVRAGWAERWDAPPKRSTRGYDTTAPLPGTKYRIRSLVQQSQAGDGAEVASLLCVATDQRLKRELRLMQAMVDHCLAPALDDAEEATLSGWLAKEDYSRDVYWVRELPRFNVEVMSVDTVAQVNIRSKGRAGGPPLTPPTGATPAG